jgi:hypothetical protein
MNRQQMYLGLLLCFSIMVVAEATEIINLVYQVQNTTYPLIQLRLGESFSSSPQMETIFLEFQPWEEVI